MIRTRLPLRDAISRGTHLGQELGHIIRLAMNNHPAIIAVVVLRNVLPGELVGLRVIAVAVHLVTELPKGTVKRRRRMETRDGLLMYHVSLRSQDAQINDLDYPL